VLTAVDVLGYQRPALLQPRAVGLVGVVLAELTNPIFPLYAQAVERSLAAFGYAQLLSTRHVGMPSEHASIALLQEHAVAGMIFISGLHSDTTSDISQYQDLRRNGLPLAFINGYIEDFDATFASDDDLSAMDLSVRHLAALGHRHVGLLNGPERYVPAARKLAGFETAMSRHVPDGTPEVHLGDYTVEAGHAAVRDLIKRGCTAAVAASDMIALGAIRGARSMGLTVPKDFSVVGYDGSPIMAFTDPPLTTITQPVEKLALAAVRSLVEEIEGSPRPRAELLFYPELIVRYSTTSAPRSS